MSKTGPEDTETETEENSPRTTLTRRGALKAGAAAGALAATGGVASAAETTTTSSDDPGEINQRSDLLDYIGDNDIPQLDTHELGTAAKSATLTALAAAAGPAGIVANAAYTQQMIFGAMTEDPQTSHQGVVEDTVYYDLQNTSVTVADLLASLGRVDEMIPAAHSQVEASTFRYRRNEVGRASAKAKTKQDIRSEVFDTWEQNYARVCEQMAMRAAGIYAYMLEAEAADDTTWRPSEDWRLKSYNTQYKDAGQLLDVNTSADKYPWKLESGKEIQVRMLTLQFGSTDTGLTQGDFARVLPLALPARSKLSAWQWTQGARDGEYTGWHSSTLEWKHPDDGYVHLPVSGKDYSDQWSGAGSHPFGQFNKHPYKRYQELLTTLDSEIEKYVDTIYDNIKPGDIPDPKKRSPGSLAWGSAIDWATTGETGLAAFSSMAYGSYGSQNAADVEVYRGTSASNVTDSTTPSKTYSGAWVVVQEQGETLETETNSVVQVLYDDTITLQNQQTLHMEVPGETSSDGTVVETLAGEQVSVSVTGSNASKVAVKNSGGSTVTASLSASSDGSSMTGSVAVSDLQSAFGDSFTISDVVVTYTDSAGSKVTETVPVGGDMKVVETLDQTTATKTGLKVGKVYNADDPAVGDVTIYVDGGGAELNAEDSFRITSYKDADGNELGALPLRTYSPQNLNNTRISDIYDRWAAAAEDYDGRDGSGAGSGTGGGGSGGGGGGTPNWMLYVGGGAIAALLAALGLQGGGGGRR